MFGFRGRLAVVLGALLGVLLGCGRLSAQGAASDTVYALHGTVTNGLTGAPVGRALVVSVDRRLATMTDNAGHFALEVRVPVPPARPGPPADATAGAKPGPEFGLAGQVLLLMAEKPGFAMRPLQGRLVALNAEASGREVQLRLQPMGNIAGQVTAEGGDVPRGVRLLLLRRAIENGRYRWRVESNQNTSAEGGFAFANLQPGAYAVMSAEWRGDMPLEPYPQTVQEYPAEFSGDSRLLTEAGVLQVRAGEAARIELHLHREPFYPVSIPLSGVTPAGIVVAVSTGVMDPEAFRLGYNEEDHAVEGRLPTGSYSVLVTGLNLPSGPHSGTILRSDNQQPKQAFGATVVQVAHGPVRTGALAFGPLPDVRVQVHLAGDSNKEAQGSVSLSLQSEMPFGGASGGSTQAGQADEFAIRNVAPGRYDVTARGDGYVTELDCDGVDLLSHALVVGASGLERPIELTLRHDGGTVTGQVSTGEGASPGFTRVLLLPLGEANEVTQTGAGADGHFEFADVAPGAYRLLAVEDGSQEFPYRNAAAMQAYADVGVPVTVTAGQAVQRNLELVSGDALEARALLAERQGTAP